MSRRGWLLFAAMCVIWGVPYMFIKVAVDEVSPVFLVLLRTAGGALLLLPLVSGKGYLRQLLPHWRILLAYTAVEVTIPWVMLSDAETRLPSSLAGLVLAAVPLLGALLGWVIGSDDRPDTVRLLGLLVGIGGVAALLGLDVRTDDLGAVGELFLCAAGYAIGPVIVQRRLAALPSSAVIVVSLAVSAVVYAPFGLLDRPATMPSAKAVTSIAVLAVVCTALAFLIFFRLIEEVGPARATVITYVNPAVAVLLGVTVLDERFTAGTAIGFPLVLLGCVLATRRSRLPAARAQTPEVHAAVETIPSLRD